MDVSADKEFRLVFHIGAGKTGTTSIQRSLRESRRDLHQLGYDYWGVMLEHAPIKKYSWQKQAVPSEFMSLPPQQASNQILDIIKNSVSRSRKRGINVAVWSHEWFFNKPQYVVPALQK